MQVVSPNNQKRALTSTDNNGEIHEEVFSCGTSSDLDGTVFREPDSYPLVSATSPQEPVNNPKAQVVPERGGVRSRRGRPLKPPPVPRHSSRSSTSELRSRSCVAASSERISLPSDATPTPQPANRFLTRARCALALGASVGVVLDCPEEEAIAGLCAQISSPSQPPIP